MTTQQFEVRLAQPDDLPSISRFWFDVYCRQMRRFGDVRDDGIDQLADPLADGSAIATAFDRSTGAVVGTLMSTFCGSRRVGVYEELYGIDRYAQSRHSVSIATNLMVAREYRRSDLGLRLARLSFRTGQASAITRSLMDCNAPLIGYFLKLGYRPDLGWISHPDYGRVFSMVLHLDDHDYLQAINSPFLWPSLDPK